MENSKGPAPIQGTPQVLGTLSLRHVEGRPRILVTGGDSIPKTLQVVNAEGKAVARFEVLDFDILPKDDPMGYLDVDVDSFMLGRAATIDDVKPDDIGQLALEYRDGQTVVVISGGKFIPARLLVVDESGTVVASYAAAAPTEEGIATSI